MNNIGPEIFDPLFHFLDRLIYEYDDILFMVLGFASTAIRAWVFSGGLRRGFCQGNESPRVSSVIAISFPRKKAVLLQEFEPFSKGHEPPLSDLDWDR